MRLLGVELRRLTARRLVAATLVGALLAAVVVLFGVFQSTRPLSAGELAQAEAMYQESLEYWEEFGEQDIALCEEERADYRETTGTEPDWTCDFEAPQREWFVNVAPPLHEALPTYVGGYGLFLLLGALVVGTTFTAAELSTGAMTTWLSFEPRRLRVYVSKLLAPAVGVVPMAAALLGVVVLGTWAIHAQAGLADGTTARHWADAAATGGRLVALAVLVAAVSAALGILLRHTAAVLGLVVGYAVLEQIVGSLFTQVQPYLVLINIRGWVEGGTLYYLETCTSDLTGTMCEYVERSVSLTHSTVYLLVLAAVVVVVSGAVFRVRDLD